MSKKVGVLTWHYYSNFGSQLQSYALLYTLKSLGLNSELIDYRQDGLYDLAPWKRALYYLATLFPYYIVKRIGEKYLFPRFRFEREFLKLKIKPLKKKELPNVAKKYDCVICGSDQIWAPNVYNSTYMLDFVPEKVRKVSYAASIGLNEIPDVLVPKYREYIGRLDNVSVREDKGKELLFHKCGIESTVVLDPTFMVSVKKWDSLTISPRLRKKYMFCYFLKVNHKYKKSVMRFAREKGLDVYGVSDNPHDSEWMTLLQWRIIGPREFLGFIRDAEMVVTDSYHCTIFSLLFRKKFATIERFSSDETVCQNSRILQLIKYFGISKQVVAASENFDIPEEEPDYVAIARKISVLRDESLEFLRKTVVEYA